MGNIKKNPNDPQIKEAKTTGQNSIEKSKEKEYLEIQEKKPKKVAGNTDEGAADELPLDAKTNNMHQKR